jgi:hypothetical protein
MTDTYQTIIWNPDIGRQEHLHTNNFKAEDTFIKQYLGLIKTLRPPINNSMAKTILGISTWTQL